MKIIPLILLLTGLYPSVLAQLAPEESSSINYRRSSLHTLLIESESFPMQEIVYNSFRNAPFPDKYNEHNIHIKTVNLDSIYVNEDERIAFGLKPKSAFYKAMSSNDSTDLANKEIPIALLKYFKKNKIANEIVAKWFHRDENGAFDVDLIAERGFYNASEMEANIAKGSARGTSSLADAGIELIGNTFVVCSKLSFVSNEIAASIIRETAYAIAKEKLQGWALLAAQTAADIVYNKTKEGYSVWTKSFLFQLEWNDSIENIFYRDYWMDANSLDPSKKELFDNTDLFQLKYIGDAEAKSLVTFSLKKGQAHRTEEEIVTLSTVRNVDHVFNKLQREYEVFMPKVPLYTGTPITAKIGKKEGLDGGEKFEVFEQVLNQETGLTEYKKVGQIKVNKKLVWDNRYNMGLESEDEKSNLEVDRTTFDGPENKFFAGMLIKQVK